jgi:hypothetical protein
LEPPKKWGTTVSNFFAKLKQFCVTAARCDKAERHVVAAIRFAAVTRPIALVATDRRTTITCASCRILYIRFFRAEFDLLREWGDSRREVITPNERRASDTDRVELLRLQRYLHRFLLREDKTKLNISRQAAWREQAASGQSHFSSNASAQAKS